MLFCSDISNSKLTELEGLYKYWPSAPGWKPQIGNEGTVKQLTNKESGVGKTFKAKEFAKLVLKHKGYCLVGFVSLDLVILL